MTTQAAVRKPPERHVKIDRITRLSLDDMDNLCDATELAISDGIGFNWMTPPVRETLESYWHGVALMPQRELFGAWLDGVLCGAIQLVKPAPNRETSYFIAKIEGHFVAPWARGHGLASGLLAHAERAASVEGFSVIRLSVRETQERALQLYRDHEYIEWGTLPCYEMVGGEMMAGHHFYKKLEPASLLD